MTLSEFIKSSDEYLAAFVVMNIANTYEECLHTPYPSESKQIMYERCLAKLAQEIDAPPMKSPKKKGKKKNGRKS